MKICVYTTHFDSYDTIYPIYFATDVDFIVFSDVPIAVHGWKNIVVPIISSGLKTNRYFKFRVGSELDSYDISCYIDASINISSDPFLYLTEKISGYQLYLAKHPLRSSYLDEARNCLVVGADLAPRMLKAVRFLLKNCSVRDRLYECGFIIIRQSDSRVREMLREWYQLWSNYSIRDQVYAPYLIDKYNITTHVENYPLYRSNQHWISLVGHSNRFRKAKKISRIFLNYTIFIFHTLKVLIAK